MHLTNNKSFLKENITYNWLKIWRTHVCPMSKGCIIPSSHEETHPQVCMWCHFPPWSNTKRTRTKMYNFDSFGSSRRNTNDSWIFYPFTELECSHHWMAESLHTHYDQLIWNMLPSIHYIHLQSWSACWLNHIRWLSLQKRIQLCQIHWIQLVETWYHYIHMMIDPLHFHLLNDQLLIDHPSLFVDLLLQKPYSSFLPSNLFQQSDLLNQDSLCVYHQW